jgi:hypothetical protein
VAARSAELADWLGIAARRCGADAAMAAFLRRPGGQEPAPGAPEAAAGAGRAELEALKPSARRKRAAAAGVPAAELEQAEDAEDPRAALIDLILAREASAAVVPELARAAELQTLKPSARRKRAAAAGVPAAKLEEAEDAEDPRAALISLILAFEASSVAVGRPTQGLVRTRSHGGAAPTSPPGVHPTFGKKHAMLSYQWDHQDQVQMARVWLEDNEVPCWMDINGGMRTNIYESMADGVQRAKCVVCFMCQKYQDSTNCGLELQFAKQRGVPIVCCKMEVPSGRGQEEWNASGWLGIVTAGALWVRFDEGMPSLHRQIMKVVAPDEAGDDREQTDDDREEAREELDRMRRDVQPAAVPVGPAGLCALPSQVPHLPEGLRITTEMKQLLSSLLAPSAAQRRIGFCGMGGVGEYLAPLTPGYPKRSRFSIDKLSVPLGKTTTSSWLVHEVTVRRQFKKIVWITLGSEPNLESLQDLLHLQLTGRGFDGERSSTAEERPERLKQAMAGIDVLLVLDDLWEQEHEACLNFVDDTTGSKVLVSSRVRGVLDKATPGTPRQSCTIVDVGVPGADEAVQMLFGMAGLPPGTSVAPEAVEIVRFCNRLPLALGIAARLVREMDVTDDWHGVAELMKEEFAATEQARSMEERVIQTSLNAIQGPHRDQILRLFRALAVVPEDTRIPVEVCGMLFEAEAGAAMPKPPPLLNIRRWLRQLIDRSLVLGTVDKPSLHDIVKDFVVSQKSEEERRAMNRRLVELWRSKRPAGGWDVRLDIGAASVSQYMSSAAVHHMRGALTADGSDDAIATEWLADFPQDAIPVLAARALGPERSEKLAEDAEREGLWWVASLRWSAAAQSEHPIWGYARALPLFERGAAALARVEPGGSACTQREKNQLEVEVLLKALQSYAVEPAATAGYNGRLQHVLETDPEAADILTRLNVVQFTDMIPPFMTGDRDGWGAGLLKLAQISRQALATVYESDHTRRCQLLQWLAGSPCWDAMVASPGFSWGLFGEGGSLLLEHARLYDYSRMHALCKWSSHDWGVCFPGGSVALALHWGDLAGADEAFDRLLPAVHQCIGEFSWTPTDHMEMQIIKSILPLWLCLLGRKRDAHDVLHAGPAEAFEPMFDAIAEPGDAAMWRKRGWRERADPTVRAALGRFSALSVFL